MFLRYLELDCGPKVIPQWLCLYSLKRWQSVSWYNLHKDLNGIKDFLVKKQFFLYWIRHRYQSKTCVEHIQQVIDKSLINPTNSSMNLYFLHVRVICFQYCKKRMRKSNQENFNFFGRIYGHVRFNFSIIFSSHRLKKNNFPCRNLNHPNLFLV